MWCIQSVPIINKLSKLRNHNHKEAYFGTELTKLSLNALPSSLPVANQFWTTNFFLALIDLSAFSAFDCHGHEVVVTVFCIIFCIFNLAFITYVITFLTFYQLFQYTKVIDQSSNECAKSGLISSNEPLFTATLHALFVFIIFIIILIVLVIFHKFLNQ